MTRGLVLVAAVVLVFGASAAARIDHRGAPVRTLAEVPGRADALAASGRRIAWINTRARCGRQVQILTLPARRVAFVGSRSGEGCKGTLGAIALAADGRVLWQWLVGVGLTVLEVEVHTAALRATQTVSGTQTRPSCCSGVFVDESAESVAAVDLRLAGLGSTRRRRGLVPVLSARARGAACGVL